MDDDQQFCLRWNNHQSTLISVFDTLLENETLVDCTLAAEGKFLKAHKVVLSACSPYFATLLQEQYDKHPIFILKDVKYQELRAMMDYMYRGEVNISQDQLGALLKAAESLQIKGLSDNRSGGGASQPKHPEHHRPTMAGKLSGGYTLEQTKRARITGAAGPAMDASEMGSREGSSSPSRRRRKVRRRSIENAMTDVHDNSNSSQQPTQSNAPGLGAITAAASALAAAAAGAPPSAAAAAAALASTVVPLSATQQQQSSSSAVTSAAPGTTLSSSKKTDNVKGSTQQQQQQDAINTDNVQGSAAGSMATATPAMDTESATDASTADKSNHKQQQQQQQSKTTTSKDTSSVTGSELVIEPKAEYDDEANDETVEDLTLDEEDMGMDDLDHNAGTSQGGEGSSQGYAPWQHDRSQDELLLATQEAQQRDPQDLSYDFSQTLTEDNSVLNLTAGANHGNGHFGGERFACAVCGKSYLRKRHLQRHMRDECIGIPPRFSCDLCPSRFRRKYHMVRHLTSKHGIPAAIAQQTTGNRTGGSSMMGGGLKKEMKWENGDGPENLTMRKEHYEAEHLTPGGGHLHLQQHHLQQLGGGGGSSPSHITSGDSGSDCNGGGTAGTSPIPPAHIMPMPTYGLTGAITAISAAAAHVEEKDAKILLEAAAAAAAAHAAATAAAGGNNSSSSAEHDNEKLENNENRNIMVDTSATMVNGIEGTASGLGGGGAGAEGGLPTPPLSATATTQSPQLEKDNTTTSVIKNKDMIKATEAAMTPNKTAALSMLDDEWKMKLSLQLISNSLLKERLMNTHLPFAYNNN
ncbi:longitudinals lacking protein, isoforms H/M/V-like isoform X4 [Musca autumnalis]|uniref:longitudinals lacking protein, isoforms H/M/V-like isoform X4 n=1 Tax=Musca autumnalis TaxID=221902 RepID=UPI003CE73563